eukprot:SAG11_NODE_1875_length_4143_cov_1.538328_4_plen_351_part_00
MLAIASTSGDVSQNLMTPVPSVLAAIYLLSAQLAAESPPLVMTTRNTTAAPGTCLPDSNPCEGMMDLICGSAQEQGIAKNASRICTLCEGMSQQLLQQAGCTRTQLEWYCCFGGLGVASTVQVHTGDTSLYSCVPDEQQLIDQVHMFAAPSNHDVTSLRVILSRRGESNLGTLVLGTGNQPTGVTLCVGVIGWAYGLIGWASRFVLSRADAALMLNQYQQQTTQPYSEFSYSGGIIEIQAGRVNVSSSHLNLSSAENGGAISVWKGRLAVLSTHFDGNNASANGGAIAIVGATNASIFASYFTNNHAQLGHGGAISCIVRARVSIAVGSVRKLSSCWRMLWEGHGFRHQC